MKTLQQAFDDLQDAWLEFVRQMAYVLKFDRLYDWLAWMIRWVMAKE